jgi:hypothetical protein
MAEKIAGLEKRLAIVEGKQAAEPSVETDKSSPIASAVQTPSIAQELPVSTPVASSKFGLGLMTELPTRLGLQYPGCACAAGRNDPSCR